MNFKELLQAALVTSMLCALAFATTTCGEEPEPEVIVLCGNGVIDQGEACDGNDVGGWTCKDIPAIGKYANGFLGCTNECVLDTAECDPCWGYPCKPDEGYGHASGEVIEDLTMIAGNYEAIEYGVRNGTPDEFALSYVYKEGASKGGRWNTALLFVTTGWCPYCMYEAAVLQERYEYYRTKGILFIGVVVQDGAGAVATAEYAQAHANDYGWTFPTIAGEFQTKYWPNQVGFPLNMLIDLNTMEILKSESGALMKAEKVDEYLADVINNESEGEDG